MFEEDRPHNFTGTVIGGPLKGRLFASRSDVLQLINQPDMVDLKPSYSSMMYYHINGFVVDGRNVGFWVPSFVSRERASEYVIKELMSHYVSCEGNGDRYD